jgi:hypothetical protein
VVRSLDHLLQKSLVGSEDKRENSDGILLDSSLCFVKQDTDQQVLDELYLFLVRPHYPLAIICYVHAGFYHFQGCHFMLVRHC